MQQVTISPKFQVVIPRKIRESLKLIPGQKMQVVQYGERIELIPHKEAHEMRGFLKTINAESNAVEGII
ncbi:MAG: AbrB/MazE/SpoVT family DNA-binding domain-containing protein [Chlorobium sp.]|nr:AbrB/MazE/SpoVT family DNA-binding domain-containing protein [Chlorobium sp.]